MPLQSMITPVGCRLRVSEIAVWMVSQKFERKRPREQDHILIGLDDHLRKYLTLVMTTFFLAPSAYLRGTATLLWSNPWYQRLGTA